MESKDTRNVAFKASIQVLPSKLFMIIPPQEDNATACHKIHMRIIQA